MATSFGILLPGVFILVASEHAATCKQDDSALLHLNASAIEALEANEQQLKQQLRELLCGHWDLINKFDPPVVVDGDKVCCEALPSCTRTCRQHDCILPSGRDKEMYLRFIESSCTMAFRGSSHQLAEVVFEGISTEATTDAYLRKLNWDRLAIWEEENAKILNQVAVEVCKPLNLLLSTSPSTALTEKTVNLHKQTGAVATIEEQQPLSALLWRITPVQHPLAQRLGYQHSFLEAISGDHHYRIEAFPSQVGIRVGAGLMSDESYDAKVLAHVSSSEMQQGVSVVSLIETMKENSNAEFDIVNNNCHKITRNTFQWAAPDQSLPESPNSVWESVAQAVDMMSPQAVNTLLEVSGASRSMCVW